MLTMVILRFWISHKLGVVPGAFEQHFSVNRVNQDVIAFPRTAPSDRAVSRLDVLEELFSVEHLSIQQRLRAPLAAA